MHTINKKNNKKNKKNKKKKKKKKKNVFAPQPNIVTYIYVITFPGPGNTE